jgi:hypothetical protein
VRDGGETRCRAECQRRSVDESPLYLRPELLAAGYSDKELRASHRAGTMQRVRRGAYLLGPEPPERAERHRKRVLAEFAALAPGSVVSHLSAAVLYGLPVWGLADEQVCATRARRSGARRGRLVHLHAAAMDPDEVRLVDGVTVTSPARTVVDIARAGTFEQALVIADAALARVLTTQEELHASARSARHRPGARRALRVVAFADGGAESVGESRSRVAIARAGLPRPLLQHLVLGPGGVPVGRVDFWWPEHRVVGEFDGEIKYGRLLRPGQQPGDVVFAEKVREDALRRQVRTVVRWTWPDLADFEPVAARLRTALG